MNSNTSVKIGNKVEVIQTFLSHGDIASMPYEKRRSIREDTHVVIAVKGNLIKTDKYKKFVNKFYFEKI